MALKEVFAVLRHQDIPDTEWKVQGPGNRGYKVVEHKREHIPDTLNCGKITFVVQVDGDAANPETLVGFVGDPATDDQGNPTLKPSAAEAITRNGAPLPGANIDGGIAGRIVIRRFKPKFRGSVIIKFQYEDSDDPDGVAEYRFEAKFGEISLPI
jgi:hypothetical protein